MRNRTSFPDTRTEALSRLEEFAKGAKRYAGARNFVTNGHTNVSRLSAAIRHRLITEEEVVQCILQHHDFSNVEKFLQEVCWRTYWKGWLAQHPKIWNHAVRLSVEHPSDLAQQVMIGKSGCEVMDDFTHELIETGYMHNHARMWWAAYWVHHLKLPWAQGADFFMRHLLDADPASNTLSWRWVAGLHTAGKSYLARPDNILRYHPHCRTGGLENLRNTVATIPDDEADSTMQSLPQWPTEWKPSCDKPLGLLLHPDDLSVELSALKDLKPSLLISLGYDEKNGSPQQRLWRQQAIADAEQRAEKHYGVTIVRCANADELSIWIKQNPQYDLVGMAPHVGSLADALYAVSKEHAQSFIWLQRPWDRAFFPAAKSGFFSFWKKISRADVFQRRQHQGEFAF
jgi:hypothetical protein